MIRFGTAFSGRRFSLWLPADALPQFGKEVFQVLPTACFGIVVVAFISAGILYFRQPGDDLFNESIRLVLLPIRNFLNHCLLAGSYSVFVSPAYFIWRLGNASINTDIIMIRHIKPCRLELSGREFIVTLRESLQIAQFLLKCQVGPLFDTGGMDGDVFYLVLFSLPDRQLCLPLLAGDDLRSLLSGCLRTNNRAKTMSKNEFIKMNGFVLRIKHVFLVG